MTVQNRKNYRGCCCTCQTSFALRDNGRGKLVMTDHSPFGFYCSGSGSEPQPGSVRESRGF